MCQLSAKMILELFVEKEISAADLTSDSLEVTEQLGERCGRYKVLGKLTKELMKREIVEALSLLEKN